MLDIEVRGDGGQVIGEVEDIIVDRNGNISRLVVEVGDFLELGDQHIGVPWKDVKIGEDMAFVQVPLKEVGNGTYSLFGRIPQGEDVAAARTSWRVHELIGDYANLEDVPRYGLVTDVVFNNRGQVATTAPRSAMPCPIARRPSCSSSRSTMRSSAHKAPTPARPCVERPPVRRGQQK
jgi:sporulation protein YlmC with PRC-barrel domain